MHSDDHLHIPVQAIRELETEDPEPFHSSHKTSSRGSDHRFASIMCELWLKELPELPLSTGNHRITQTYHWKELWRITISCCVENTGPRTELWMDVCMASNKPVIRALSCCCPITFSTGPSPPCCTCANMGGDQTRVKIQRLIVYACTVLEIPFCLFKNICWLHWKAK